MKTLKIQSMSDIITNSSSEVFVFKINEDFDDFMNAFRWSSDVTVFKTWEDLKKYLMSDYGKYDDALSEMSCWPSEFGDIYSFCAIVNRMKEYRTEDEILEFYKPIFSDMIGKAFISFDNNNIGDMDSEIRKANEKLKKLGKKTTNVHEEHGY